MTSAFNAILRSPRALAALSYADTHPTLVAVTCATVLATVGLCTGAGLACVAFWACGCAS